MFYCDMCRKRKGWPQSLAMSIGACEVCGEAAECWDTPSYRLPPTTAVLPSPKDVINQWFIERYKIKFGSELLNNGLPDGMTVEERLGQWESWEPDVGQKSQAEGDTEMLLAGLDKHGYEIRPKQ